MQIFKSIKYFTCRKVNLILLSSVVLGGIFSGCRLIPKEQAVHAPELIQPPSVKYKTHEVKKGTIVNELNVSGTFVPSKQQLLYFEGRGGYLGKVYVKSGDNVKKGDLLAELDGGDLSFQVKQQQLKIEMAELAYEQCKNSNASESEIKKAELQVEYEKIELERMQSEAQKSSIVSPIAGKIEYAGDLKLGEYINAYKSIFKIYDPAEMLLEYSGDKYKEFKLGMKVNMNYNGQVCPAQVVRISDNITDENGKTVCKVYIRPDKILEKASFGDNASVNVVLAKKEDAIIIPLTLVQKYEGFAYVRVLDNNTPSEKFIQTGIEANDSIEVVSGLKEGDMIVTN